MAEDERGNEHDDEATGDSPLHAYSEGREDDVAGDVEKLKSGDPEESQRKEIADDEGFDEKPDPPDKH